MLFNLVVKGDSFRVLTNVPFPRESGEVALTVFCPEGCTDLKKQEIRNELATKVEAVRAEAVFRREDESLSFFDDDGKGRREKTLHFLIKGDDETIVSALTLLGARRQDIAQERKDLRAFAP